MKLLSGLFIGVSLLTSGFLAAAPESCACKNCYCTPDKHCGCFSADGCGCTPEHCCCGGDKK